jgi:hypothetical protein
MECRLALWNSLRLLALLVLIFAVLVLQLKGGVLVNLLLNDFLRNVSVSEIR